MKGPKAKSTGTDLPKGKPSTIPAAQLESAAKDRLIAELLEACRVALHIFDQEWGGEITDGPGTIRHVLRQAIAKAEGT